MGGFKKFLHVVDRREKTGGTTSFFYPSFFFHPSFYFQVILPSFFKEKPSFFLSILPSFIMYTSFFFLFLCIQPSFFPIPFFFYVFNHIFLTYSLLFFAKCGFLHNTSVPALSMHPRVPIVKSTVYLIKVDY